MWHQTSRCCHNFKAPFLFCAQRLIPASVGGLSRERLSVGTAQEAIVMAASLFGKHRKRVAGTSLSRLFVSPPQKTLLKYFYKTRSHNKSTLNPSVLCFFDQRWSCGWTQKLLFGRVITAGATAGRFPWRHVVVVILQSWHLQVWFRE